MNPGTNQIEALLADESFLKYCGGDEQEKLYWESQLQQNPALGKQAEQARKLYELVKAELVDVPAETERFRTYIQEYISANGRHYENQPPVIHMPVRRKVWMWTAVAILGFMLGAGGYLLYLDKPATGTARPAQQKGQLNNDVAPGGNKAVLTLADGSQIVLDSADNGTLSQQGNVKVIKLNSGQLSYQQTAKPVTAVLYNTVSTPRGGQYKIMLSDGTVVWLNAASSIRYPAAFTGNERRVAITGEAYFEVVKNAAMPFKVDVQGMEIAVLGTHFNVNSYDDEPSIRTTLIEGAVSIKKQAAVAFMKPGEQVQVTKTGEMKTIPHANVEAAIAWKNGLFQFNHTSLDEVLRQLVRWYDVEVEFQGKPPTQRFGGEIPRDSDLSEVLKILNYSRVKFSIEHKKIIIRS